MKNIADKSADDIAECKMVARRVSVNENVVRTVENTVKVTETEIRKQYTRSMYETSVCRQMSLCALKTMERTLGLVRTMYFSKAGSSACSTGEVGNDMVDFECTKTSKQHTTTNKLQEKVECVLQSVLNL